MLIQLASRRRDIKEFANVNAYVFRLYKGDTCSLLARELCWDTDLPCSGLRAETFSSWNNSKTFDDLNNKLQFSDYHNKVFGVSDI